MTGESVKARGEQEKKHVGENRREKNYSPDNNKRMNGVLFSGQGQS